MKKLLLMALLAGLICCAVWALPEAGFVRVTAFQSRQYQLPPVAFHLDCTGSYLHAVPFPERDNYLLLNGRPGGPLSVRVLATSETDAAGLERFVRIYFENARPFQWGKGGTLQMAGQQCPTLGFVSGSSVTRTQWCAVLVPKGPVIVLFGAFSYSGVADDGLKSTLAHPSLAQVVRTFQLD